MISWRGGRHLPRRSLAMPRPAPFKQHFATISGAVGRSSGWPQAVMLITLCIHKQQLLGTSEQEPVSHVQVRCGQPPGRPLTTDPGPAGARTHLLPVKQAGVQCLAWNPAHPVLALTGEEARAPRDLGSRGSDTASILVFRPA